VRIFSQNLNLLTAAKVVNGRTAYMDSLFERGADAIRIGR
jgi:hypothetical protein